MPHYSSSISINASQEAIWKVLSDVAYWNEWTPTVTRVEVLDAPELKLDNRYKVFQPKLQPAIWSVTVLMPPSNFTWKSRMPGMLMVAEHILSQMVPIKTNLPCLFLFTAHWAPSSANCIAKRYKAIWKPKRNP